jgi:hypothetical protein
VVSANRVHPGAHVAAVVVVQGVDDISILEQFLMLTQGPVGAFGRDDELDAHCFHRFEHDLSVLAGYDRGRGTVTTIRVRPVAATWTSCVTGS